MKNWLKQMFGVAPISTPAHGEISASPASAGTLGELQRLGNEARIAGDTDHAERLYQQAVALDPSFAPAFMALGLIAFDQHDFAAAHSRFNCVLSLQPGSVDANFFLGLLAEQQGQDDEAVSRFVAALSEQPGFLPALKELAPLCQRLDRIGIAEQALLAALPGHPNQSEILLLLAMTLYAQQRFEESIVQFSAALAQDPRRIEALVNRAEACLWLRRYEEAKQDGMALIALYPARAEGHLILARCHFGQRRMEQSAQDAANALRADPQSHLAEFQLGLINSERQQDDQAYRHFEKSVALAPTFGEGWLWLSRIDFNRRRYSLAWREYEGRLLVNRSNATEPGQMMRRMSKGRRWHGEPSEEDVLYLWVEQGFGDNLMMLPLARRAVQRFGGQVRMHCFAALARLVSAYLPEVMLLISVEDVPDDALNCPLMSLAHELGDEQWPKAQPRYLAAPEEAKKKFEARLRRLDGLKVGLVWQGRPGYPEDQQRSIALDVLAPLAEVAAATFVSLQLGADTQTLHAFPVPLHDWTVDIRDFADTAAIMEGLDLVISIDSAPAHLAGALGVPVWMFNRFGGEWRWGRNREDNDWYRSMRVFYQSVRGQWGPVVADMCRRLTALGDHAN